MTVLSSVLIGLLQFYSKFRAMFVNFIFYNILIIFTSFQKYTRYTIYIYIS